jgi:hypothetical protein
LKECNDDFLKLFWECVANILDYFADFVTTDTAMWQSIWYHLLDVLQEATDLPHKFWFEHKIPQCRHSKQFTRDYEQTQEIINEVITTKNLPPSEALMHLNRAEKCVDKDNHVGGFKSGLKPWQQFLYGGSPGFDVPESDRVYAQGAPGTAGAATSEQFVPLALRTIIHQHTKRLRSLTVKVAQVSAILVLSLINILSKLDGPRWSFCSR